MIDESKIVKIELIASDGALILEVKKNFSFPNNYEDEDKKLGGIMLMIKGRSLPELDMNSQISIIISAKSGDRTKYSGFITISSEFQLNVMLYEHISSVMEERRHFYKVKVEIECKIPFLTRNDKLVRFSTPLIGNIKDFNIGGIFLSALKVRLIESDIALVIMPMLGEDVEVLAQVIRAQSDPAGNCAGYGCRFINTTSNAEEIFSQFVYTKQLEQRKKDKERQAVAEEITRRDVPKKKT